MMNSWTVESEERLLTFVKQKTGLKTKDLRWSIEYNRCSVNHVVERFASRRLKRGDQVQLFPETRPAFERDPHRILYEDEWLLLYDKPPHIDSPTLAELLGLFLVHRLDRDTTGVILFAKDTKTRHALENLFRKREIHKEYLALVEGKTEENGVIESRVDGKQAKTLWKREKVGLRRTLVRCFPYTGRKHQIRIHLKQIGHPIVGDCEYGNRRSVKNIFRPLLHAVSLRFTHPELKKELLISAEISYPLSHVEN